MGIWNFSYDSIDRSTDDADSTRVAKGTISKWSCDPSTNGFKTTNDFVLGLGGEQVTEMGVDTSAGSSATTLAWQHTNVWAGGKLLGTYDKTGLHFYLDDPLGTRRAQTNYAGVLEQTCSSLRYGDALSCTGGDLAAPTEHHFTGKERDAESGNDYFGARYYASSIGRWLSPDWSAKEEPVPYAKMDDPQTLNLYAYVGNNPLTRTDADGHVVTLGEDPKRARKDYLKNTSAKEQKLFKTVKDKSTGQQKLTINEKAAAKFSGTHTAGFNKISSEIGSDKTINLNVAETATIGGQTHNISQDYGGGATFTDGNGVVQVFVSPKGNPIPTMGLDGKTPIPDPEHIIMGHESLGHGPGRMGMEGADHSEHHAVDTENQLRREQGLPERQPQ
jgi:RHS repeat-associated protein